MQRDRGRPRVSGAAGGVCVRSLAGITRAVACLALCLATADCASVGQSLASFAQARERGVSVAFEPIEGLAGDNNAALVRDLTEEAAAFHIAIVPEGGEAAYRIRSYVATHAGRQSASARTSAGTVGTVSWAWDVYDSALHRAVRLSGEERTAGGKNAAIDEALLRRIARTGMEQLADFMATNPPAGPLPAHGGTEVAGRDDASSKDIWTQIAAWGR